MKPVNEMDKEFGRSIMKKRISIAIVILSCFVMITGCSLNNSAESALNNLNLSDRNNTVDSVETKTEIPYCFKILSRQSIDDTTLNGVTITIFVEKTTGTMYMQTEKYQAGYGVGLVQMLNADGTPMIYTGQ